MIERIVEGKEGEIDCVFRLDKSDEPLTIEMLNEYGGRLIEQLRLVNKLSNNLISAKIMSHKGEGV